MNALNCKSLSRAVAAVNLLVSASAMAALPVFGGASLNLQNGSGYVNAQIGSSPGHSVLNNGTAIGQQSYFFPLSSTAATTATDTRLYNSAQTTVTLRNIAQ